MDTASISDSATLQASLTQMRDEFRRILFSISPAVKNIRLQSQSDPSSTYADSEYSWYSLQEGMTKNIDNDAIDSLRAIAEQMVDAGHSAECIEVYTRVRKRGVDELIKPMGIERMSSKNIQRLEWRLQEEKIQLWIQAAEICFRGLFPGERELTNKIFASLGTNNMADDCFMMTVKDSVIKLFDFVEAISSSRRSSPKKLFRMLELYDAISDLSPDIEAVFGLKSGEFIRKQAVEIRCSLSEAVREILSEFEKAVFGEILVAPIPKGSVHPSTIYVMDYVSLMVEYKEILIELIVSKPETNSGRPDLDFSEFEQQGSSPLVLHLLWITKNLRFNLKAKSKQYKDASLAHFFIMNNVHYIVEKIKGSEEFREMIGDDYLNKLTGEYNLAASDYLKTSWKRILDCLRSDGDKMGGFLCGFLSRFVLRQRFKAFNVKFKDVLRNQATWFVDDVELREELRFSILQMLIPLYTTFLDRYRSCIESEKQPEKYIKYSPEDVEEGVMHLFDD